MIRTMYVDARSKKQQHISNEYLVLIGKCCKLVFWIEGVKSGSLCLLSFSNPRKIQEESLRTYIFTYAETYDCLSLERLAEMFELPSQAVHSIVSKMIFREEFLVSF